VPPEVAAARADPRRRFGHFLVLAELGRGGMGIVYKAWDDALGRTVALKLLAADADAAARERFHREALAVARLRHPSIVAIHDAGEANGHGWIAMDFIDGMTLDKRIKERALPLNRGIEVLRAVARAIHYAHEQGIVHRDLKPQNVILGSGDHPFVLDFGLATALVSEGAITKTGSMLGTPAYMPPEQVEGSSADVSARSDVYSLGATLYHVIAGRPPFGGGSELNLIAALLTKDPDPPSRFNRRALGDLDTIALKCLEKDPAKRYGTAEELAQELERWLNGDAIVARPLGFFARTARRVRRNALAVAAASVAALVSAGAIGYAALAPRLEAGRRAARVEQARLAARGAAASLRSSVATKLDAVERGLAAAGQGSIEGQILAAADAVAPIATEDAVRRRLADAARGAGGSLEAGEVDAAVAAAAPELVRSALLARAERLEAAGWRRLGGQHEGDATREAARAYRLDPAGEDGARAFLEVAEEIVARREWKRAALVLEALLSRRLPRPALVARAELGAAKAALALGDVPLSRAHVRRALAARALAAQAGADLAASVGEEADFLLAVTTKLLAPAAPAIPIFGEIVLPRPDGKGPPRIAGFLRTTPRRIGVLEIDERGEGFRELASTEVGPEERSALALVGGTDAQRFVCVVSRSSGKTLEVFKLEGDALSLERTVVLPLPARIGVEDVQVRDLDGDGRPDLVFTASNGRNWPIVVRDVLGTPVVDDAVDRIFHADGPSGVNGGSDTHAPIVADLDGNGKASLIVASSKWSGFCLRVVDWPAPGGPAAVVAQKVVGVPCGLRLFREASGREVVYAGGDRDAESEAMFDMVERPGDPQVSDTIWRLSRAPGQGVVFEPVLERPFADHLDGSLAIAGVGWFGKRWPASFVALEKRSEYKTPERRWVFVPAPGKPPLYLARRPEDPDDAVSVVGFAADFDGDGEPELVRRMPEGLLVSGLRALGPPPEVAEDAPAAPRDASPLDVGLDILACGEAAEAASQLGAVVDDDAASVSDRARAALALARAQALLGKHDLARKTCLDLANREPGFAKEALLAAEDHAEVRADYAAALADLDRLEHRVPLSADEMREVERRARRVHAIASLVEAVRVDPSTIESLPWIVRHPLQVERSADGLAIHGLPSSGTEPFLRLPLRYAGASFRLRARFVVEALPFGTAFYVNVTTATGTVGARIECIGGGDVNAWHRNLGLSAGSWRLEDIDPSEPIDVDLVYSAEDGRVVAHASHGPGELRVEGWCDRPLGTEHPRLEIGVGGWAPPNTYLRVRLLEAVIDAARQPNDGDRPQYDVMIDARPPSDVSDRETAPAYGRFVAGDRASAEPLLAALAARPGPWQRQAALCRGVALAAGGHVEDAAALLESIGRADPQGLGELLAATNALGPESRDALTRAYGAIHGGDREAISRRADECLRDQRWGEGLVALLAARADATPNGAVKLAYAFAALGEQERALDLVKPFLATPQARALSGIWLCERHRYAEALELFGDMPLSPMDEPYRRRAARFTAAATGAPR
jgi:hypothetical protein